MTIESRGQMSDSLDYVLVFSSLFRASRAVSFDPIFPTLVFLLLPQALVVTVSMAI